MALAHEIDDGLFKGDREPFEFSDRATQGAKTGSD
jgi:hypothetical protein